MVKYEKLCENSWIGLQWMPGLKWYHVQDYLETRRVHVYDLYKKNPLDFKVFYNRKTAIHCQ